jgi:biopolymer transport protein ExbD/biopolymer transport protein TolR
MAGVTPDMNVTPLVDVVLVLLIIFMVVAPRLEQDVEVELPGIFNPDPETKQTADPLKVTVAQAGEYYIESQKYDLDAAVEHLTMVRANDPYRRLVLRADARLTYGQVRELFGRVQELGFPGIGLMVGERHKPGQEPPPAATPATPES